MELSKVDNMTPALASESKIDPKHDSVKELSNIQDNMAAAQTSESKDQIANELTVSNGDPSSVAVDTENGSHNSRISLESVLAMFDLTEADLVSTEQDKLGKPVEVDNDSLDYIQKQSSEPKDKSTDTVPKTSQHVKPAISTQKLPKAVVAVPTGEGSGDQAINSQAISSLPQQTAITKSVQHQLGDTKSTKRAGPRAARLVTRPFQVYQWKPRV